MGQLKIKFTQLANESALRDAGFETIVVNNQGKGAAKARIEAVRRIFPAVWFNKSTTEAGRDALEWYHEKKDEQRNIGLGPNHDWSSHAADAFGLMAIVHSKHSIERIRMPEFKRRTIV